MSTQLKNGMEAATLEGSKVKFDLTSGVKVSGAKVIKADIQVDNGVIHGAHRCRLLSSRRPCCPSNIAIQSSDSFEFAPPQ